MNAPHQIADDRLDGIAEIAAFLGLPKRRVAYLASTGMLRVGREGRRIVASKKRLAQDYEKLVSGADAA